MNGVVLALACLTAAVMAQQHQEDQFQEMKRKSAYMRFGRSDPQMAADDAALFDMDKRKSAYMRFGKRSSPVEEMLEEAPIDTMEKRKSAYMRFGKRKSAYMRFGKRSMDLMEEPMDMEKRKSAYMRFGK